MKIQKWLSVALIVIAWLLSCLMCIRVTGAIVFYAYARTLVEYSPMTYEFLLVGVPYLIGAVIALAAAFVLRNKSRTAAV